MKVPGILQIPTSIPGMLEPYDTPQVLGKLLAPDKRK